MQPRIRRAISAGLLIWLGATVCSAGVLYGEPGFGQPRLTALVLGLLFSAYAMAACWVAGHLRSLGAAVLVCWGSGMGLWFPLWQERLGGLLPSVLASMEIEHALLVQLPWPVAVASVGIATAVVLSIATGSGRVAAQTALLSLVAAMASLVPWHDRSPAILGVLLWHSGVAASLCHASIKAVRGGAGLACSHCGRDAVGLTSPVCPGCGNPLGRVEPPSYGPRPSWMSGLSGAAGSAFATRPR